MSVFFPYHNKHKIIFPADKTALWLGGSLDGLGRLGSLGGLDAVDDLFRATRNIHIQAIDALGDPVVVIPTSVGDLYLEEVLTNTPAARVHTPCARTR